MMALQIADDTQEHAWHATQPASEVDIPPMLAAALVPNPASKPSAWPILDKPFGDPQKLSKTEKKTTKRKNSFSKFFFEKEFFEISLFFGLSEVLSPATDSDSNC